MDSEKISAVYSMLHLIFHRNKNQHAKSKWWKWLSILKRTTFNLRRCLGACLSHEGLGSSAAMYRQYLSNHVVPNCYAAFSTIVADGQFSTLGIVLLALLARLARATGVDRDARVRSRKQRSATPSHRGISAKEDIGELISREVDTPVSSVGSERPVSSEPVASATDNAEPPKSREDKEAKASKKKRRRKNAIDDLFDGLL